MAQVAAVAWLWSLARELPHVVGAAKKKKKKITLTAEWKIHCRSKEWRQKKRSHCSREMMEAGMGLWQGS